MHGFKTIEEFTLEECEAFLKRNDISSEDRRRVKERMGWLLAHPWETPGQPKAPQRQKTIAEEFPEYRFVLTSTLKEKKYGLFLNGRFYIILGVLLEVLFSFIILVEFDGEIDELLPILFFISMVCLSVYAIVEFIKKKFSPIKTVADYISENSMGRRGKRTIFVKSRKFGVLHSIFHRVIIGAQYDQLSWLNDDVLLGRVNGKYLLIDKDGKTLTPKYDHITKNDEATLEAVDGEKRFLIDFYGNII